MALTSSSQDATQHFWSIARHRLLQDDFECTAWVPYSTGRLCVELVAPSSDDELIVFRKTMYLGTLGSQIQERLPISRTVAGEESVITGNGWTRFDPPHIASMWTAHRTIKYYAPMRCWFAQSAVYWSPDSSGAESIRATEAQDVGLPALLKGLRPRWSRCSATPHTEQEDVGSTGDNENPTLRIDNGKKVATRRRMSTLQMAAPMVRQNSGHIFRWHRFPASASLRILGLLTMILGILLADRLPFQGRRDLNTDRMIIASAIQHAQVLEVWLDNNSFTEIIDILGSDITRYNSLQREGVRARWVQRRLRETDCVRGKLG
ncbi:hypothetical protein DFH09DRAFT_1079740 [Mycena vulgaris]|nr:hypothetical protein DFH09DRAFT_1416065 [Mycena vulgaris]KAJ6572533.1 hypothetical protein DFH09DRAFT_1079740 [Mycena vulgaris]